jgi:exonuclease I
METTVKEHLKIKMLSLGAEARVIRIQEQRLRNRIRKNRAKQFTKTVDRDESAWASIREHRLKVVRPEARASLLAYGFLRGREYLQMEPKTYTKLDPDRILTLAKKFGSKEQQINMPTLKAWLTRVS